MENMKRAISAFLALVLVLGMVPGVPVFAAAEEAETLPEAMAVETTEATTEATTEPEETEPATSAPAETVPEQSVPETTGAAETVPAVTEPAETVPETTAAPETVPEETVPEETVPEETVPEETAAEETIPEETTDEMEIQGDILGDIKDQTPVENIIVTAETRYTYLGDEVQMYAEVLPANAWNKNVVFKVVDTEPAGLDFDEMLLESDGVLKAFEAGRYAVAADSVPVDTDDENYTYEGDPDAQPFWVEFVGYGMKINRWGIPKENWFNYDPDYDKDYGELPGEYVKIMYGESLDLSVHYLEEVEGTENVTTAMHTPNVEWSLAPGDEAYANLVVDKDDCKNVTIHVKDITEPHMVTLTATDWTLWNGDLTTGIDTLEITVYPRPYKVGVYQNVSYPDTYSDNVDDEVAEEILIDLNQYDLEGGEKITLDLSAQVWPLEAEEPVTWSASNSYVRFRYPYTDPDTEEEIPSWVTLTVDPYVGSTTVTVKSLNYPKEKTFVIRRQWLVPAIEWSKETHLIQNVVSGKSVRLEALDSRDNTIMTSKEVKWELAPGDEDYAAINQNGVLTAKSGLHVGKKIKVICSVIGNETVDEAVIEKEISVRPVATSVEILAVPQEDDPDQDALNNTIHYKDTSAGLTGFKLYARVYPLDKSDEELGALQDVTWLSSKSTVASIDSRDGKTIQWKRNGQTVITATAGDGSRVKATVTLKFGTPVQDVEIDVPDNFFLRSGKSHTFEVKFNQTPQPTDKSVAWTLANPEDAAFVTLSANGRLTAKTVYENKQVEIEVIAKDRQGTPEQVSKRFTVSIWPKTENILSLYSNGECVTKTTLIVGAGEYVTLEAVTVTDGGNDSENVTWKSSNRSVAEVNEFGEVYVKKNGSATITATADDGTRRTATVTIKGVQLAEEVIFTHKHNQHALASGKSLTLNAKAVYMDDNGNYKNATVSKVAWSVQDPDHRKYVSVNNSGRVTAAAGYKGAPVDVVIVASATDGSGEEATWDLTIAPIATGIQILDENSVELTTMTFPLRTPYNRDKTGETMDSDGEIFTLKVKIGPENAADVVKWTTSNKKIADFVRDDEGNVVVADDGTCEVIALKAGTVTITATADDGSNKKDTVRLTIVHCVTDITFEDPGIIAGGKSLTLKPILRDGNGSIVKGKKLEWSITKHGDDPTVDGTAFVSGFKNGVLKTTSVTALKKVLISVKTVETNDDWVCELPAPREISIYPATTKVEITNEDGDVINEPLWVTLGDTIYLGAYALPMQGSNVACQEFNWVSSNPKMAEIDEFGVVTIPYNAREGTVTIKAIAKDGTRKQDSIKLTINK